MLVGGILIPLSAGCLFAQQLSLPNAVAYTISLANSATHLVQVTIDLPSGPAERDLQLPVWYALYQIRDFAQYVNRVRIVKNSQGSTIRKIDKSRWRMSGVQGGARVQYEVFADDSGPYGAQLNSHHAFFNLAEILMYPPDSRDSPMQVHIVDIPQGWRIVTELTVADNTFAAKNYDELADSPVEISAFDERDFDDAGGHYRIIVDAEHGDYDMDKIVAAIRRIVAAETTWMNDRPFDTYTFIYHFPRGQGGGGMEHANGTAIDTIANDFGAFEGVTAHEFFHLWNVKRIRPQTLQPPDYTKENYTNALWFSEGFTSTVEHYALLRAGLLDAAAYLAHLGAAITELENRPAHLTQSADESSIDAWLEKYPDYRKPQRSISYYNKGELLGVILDLKLRDATSDTKSLRELFEWMNSNYAQKDQFFSDSIGVRQSAEAVSHVDLKPFFEQYVSGTGEIPWNDFFNTVGLHIAMEKIIAPDVGFEAARNFDGPPVVLSVEKDSAASVAGLANGDVILKINGHTPGRNFQQLFRDLRAGDKIDVRIRSRNGERELTWKIGGREETQFQLKDLANVTPLQKTRRAAWLKGESEPSGDQHP